MPPFLQQLYSDHEHIRDLLRSLHCHLDELEASDRPVDDLLNFGLSSWKDFLDETHHSKEEYVYSRLRQRAPACVPIIQSLALQHNELERHMEGIARSFSVMAQNSRDSRNAMIEAGRELLDEYLRHLEWEEQSFFPLARRYLQGKDWSDIEAEWGHDNHNQWREISHEVALQAFQAAQSNNHPSTPPR